MADYNYPYYHDKWGETRINVLENLCQIIFEAQYAKEGFRAGARRQAAEDILEAVEKAYKLHVGGDYVSV